MGDIGKALYNAWGLEVVVERSAPAVGGLALGEEIAAG